MKRLIIMASGLLSLLAAIGLLICGEKMVGKLPEQQMASRWSDEKDVSQVSCFFAVGENITTMQIEDFQHALDAALVEASITTDSPNASARLWADAYSAWGEVSITHENKSVTVDALGVGGDFFLFHPLDMISGSYFSKENLNSDCILIDEDTAWQLFGSNDIAGQIVTIGGIPHVISGVVDRKDADMYEKAGLENSLAYLSFDSLNSYGTHNGISHYEIVMPNPVSKYAYSYVKDHINVKEDDMEIVENTTRYSFLNKLLRIKEFGTRSMNRKAVIYPYWENVARGYEDILGVMFPFMILFFLYPAILIIVWLWKKWKARTWTAKDVFHKGKDLLGDKLNKSKQRRLDKKKRKKDEEDL